MQLLAISLLLAPATAFVAAPARAMAVSRPAVTAQPQMLLSGAPMPEPAQVALAVDAASQLLAGKSAGDELLEEIFLTFPTVFTGICLAFFASAYIEKSDLTASLAEGLDDLPIPLPLIVVPVVTIGFVGLGKLGVLGAASGTLAKGLLDGWNIFASVALPGALLKY